ncbi:bifunctional adenosylcobinamide kinase/adenosylcobinamide-phosphate guanylyltransferase [Phormidium sp. CCY1219]|uniref:bifunctional adenosylcobinamide kinase/adenosylcobinamide-phosphate guanylyltransferase n=1 Tax=Phormidium sp. CCY1219 TaxID=2886104 RepID=UPI002D1F09F1|nr:bifunctional adenosylcobinamide kinase/adenosylcobinamide-phosphate guanylyltransferase [Phormidium sp. CCY1219]MEB3826962.1 bifunctional adenosylcobinamide kinase/adenosylcobinamide-phosphate guanylyltransferase [Phormidium sp. CCY1219]
MSAKQVVLVTGPARSGKSEWAEMLAEQMAQPTIYVATARVDPSDAEWVARIERHRMRRMSSWKTMEVPTELAQTIQSAPPNYCLLVDSLGTWVANLLDCDRPTWDEIERGLLSSLHDSTADAVIFVAEETGWGVVPAYPMGRLFRDRLGTLVRRLGAIAHPVYLVTGGHVLNLSRLGSPLPPGNPESEDSLPE